MPEIELPIVLTEAERAEAAHRLRNPLAIISGSAELILLTSNCDEDRQRARAILVAVKRLHQEYLEVFGL